VENGVAKSVLERNGTANDGVENKMLKSSMYILGRGVLTKIVQQMVLMHILKQEKYI